MSDLPASAHVVARAQSDRLRRSARTLRYNAKALDTLENVDGRIAATLPWRYDEWFRYYFTFRNTDKIPEVRIRDDELELKKQEPPPQLTEEDFPPTAAQIRQERRQYEGRGDDEKSVSWTEIEDQEFQEQKQAASDVNFLFDLDQRRDKDSEGLPQFINPEERRRYMDLKGMREETMREANPAAARQVQKENRQREQAAIRESKKAQRAREKQERAAARPQRPRAMDESEPNYRPVNPPPPGEEEEEDEEGDEVMNQEEEEGVEDDGETYMEEGTAEAVAPRDAPPGPVVTLPAPTVPATDMNSSLIIRNQPDTRVPGPLTLREQGRQNVVSRRRDDVADMLTRARGGDVQKKTRPSIPRRPANLSLDLPVPPASELRLEPVDIQQQQRLPIFGPSRRRDPIVTPRAPASKRTTRPGEEEADDILAVIGSGQDKRMRVGDFQNPVFTPRKRPTLTGPRPPNPAQVIRDRRQRFNVRDQRKVDRLTAIRDRAEGII